MMSIMNEPKINPIISIPVEAAPINPIITRNNLFTKACEILEDAIIVNFAFL